MSRDEYVESFTLNLMVPFFRWASGATFREITDNTLIYEGTLIRCARRLMELMNQVIFAAEQIGEKEMQEQMEAALKCMQRGIMFSGSLYL
jgi:superfamily II RNA helicase